MIDLLVSYLVRSFDVFAALSIFHAIVTVDLEKSGKGYPVNHPVFSSRQFKIIEQVVKKKKEKEGIF
jgi:hypothetical protein